MRTVNVKEEEVDVKEEVNFNNDYFFKFALGSEDEDAIFIRNTIIERVTGICPKKSIVLNPNLDPAILDKKRIVLDLHVRDEVGREYGIEMQTAFSGISEIKRFEFYGSRMLSNQLENGAAYHLLQPIFQIIFIDSYAGHRHRLMDCFQMRNKEGDLESRKPSTNRIYIHLPHINEIAKHKHIQEMNDFEQLCYLFENNENSDILKSEERLVRTIMEKHRIFQDDKDLWSIAMAAQIQAQREKCAISDSFDEGMKEGEGKGMRQLLCKLVKQKYNIDADTWLNSQTIEQVSAASELLLVCDTFDELKKALNERIQ